MRKRENKAAMFVFGFDRVFREEERQKELYEDSLRRLFSDSVTSRKSGSLVLFGPSKYFFISILIVVGRHLRCWGSRGQIAACFTAASKMSSRQ